MRAIVYCRVSTEAQGRDGTSLETQEEACLRYVTDRGYQLSGVEREVGSGASLERSALERVREAVRRGEAQAIVAYSLDRLSRSQNHVGILDDECQRFGAQLEFVTERFEDTPVGRFVRAARAFTDEIEREKIRERTMRGKARRAREGRLVQGTGLGIYGYRLSPVSKGGDGRRRVNEEQAAVVRRIFLDFADGLSCHAIAEQLDAEGVETMRGWRLGQDGTPLLRVQWHPLTVRRILRNETYTGRAVYGRTRVETYREPITGKKKRRVVQRPMDDWIEIPGSTPAIIDRGLWERVQMMLDDPARRGRRGHALHPYPLSGHIRCSECRAPLAGSALSGGKGREGIRYYTCRYRYQRRRERPCSSRYVRAEDLERRVVEGLRRVVADPAEIVSAYNRIHATAEGASAMELEQAKDRVADAEAQIARLARLARFAGAEGATDAIALELKAASLLKRSAEADLAELLGRRASVNAIDADPAMLESLSEQVAAWLDSEDPEKVKLAMDGLEVTVWAGTGEPRASGYLPVQATHKGNGDAHVRPVVRGVRLHPSSCSPRATPRSTG